MWPIGWPIGEDDRPPAKSADWQAAPHAERSVPLSLSHSGERNATGGAARSAAIPDASAFVVLMPAFGAEQVCWRSRAVPVGRRSEVSVRLVRACSDSAHSSHRSRDVRSRLLGAARKRGFPIRTMTGRQVSSSVGGSRGRLGRGGLL